MSGRPSRNCKRRTASEMLGMSPAKSGSKKGATSSSPSKAKRAKNSADTPEAVVSPKASTRSTRGKPQETDSVAKTPQKATKKKASSRGRKAKAAAEEEIISEPAASNDEQIGTVELVVESSAELVEIKDSQTEPEVTEMVEIKDANEPNGDMESIPSVVHVSEVNEIEGNEFESDGVERLIDPENITETETTGLIVDTPTNIDDEVADEETAVSQPEQQETVQLITVDSSNIDMVNSAEPEEETTTPETEKESAVSSAAETSESSQLPVVITVHTVKSQEKGKQMITASLKPTETPTKTSSASISSSVAEVTTERPRPPITKTYVVGKNNRIQELLTKPVPLPPASNNVSNVVMETVSSSFRSGESDDEEYELEDEFDRIASQGYNNDVDLFDPKPTDLVDENVRMIYDTIQPTDTLDNHSIYLLDTGFKCNYCNTVYVTKKDFAKHLRDEHKSTFSPWSCPLCPFTSIFQASLMSHMNIHTTVKPYVCELCNRGFAYKQKLETHLKYHNDVRDQKCLVAECFLSFCSPESLMIHRERRHKTGKRVGGGKLHTLTLPDRTSLVDAIEMLTSTENSEDPATSTVTTNATSDAGVITVQKGSIKISDVTADGQETTVSGSNTFIQGNESGSLPVAVVAESDIIGNPDSLVQIMPISYRNEGGMPETINVVITVPQNEAMKNKAAAGSTSATEGVKVYDPTTQVYLSTHNRKTTIDDELLPYCEVLDRPIHCNNQRAFIKCTVCSDDSPGYFGSVTQFCEHLRKDHSDKNIKPYKCSQCDYTCRVKGNLDQHVKFHATERPFVCHICNKGFIQKYKLNLHLKFHENKREWPCTQCNSAFNDKQDLSRHMKNVHFDPDKGVKCPHCERVFKNEYMLEQHIHVHTGEKKYKCDVCGKLYSTRESLRSHMKGHQFQFGCEICAKPLGSYSAFIAHKRLHDPNQKGYQCEMCGKVLLFKATLEAHIKSVHSDERAFSCDQCTKSFKTQGQLNNHMISHTKDKPYSCHICGYAVKRKDSLRQHMYRHAEVKPYRCGRCGKEYTQKQALEIHLKSKHAGVTTFNCTMCEKGFNTNYLLRKHMQKAHCIDLVHKMPRSEQVIIAQQEVDDAVDSEPPAPSDDGVQPPHTKRQTVLINAHICDHCHEVFVSQHALAVHILSEHMNQKVITTTDEVTNVPTNAEDGQVVNISETIEIPIGEEMVLVQSVEPGVLNEAIEQGATRVDPSLDGERGTIEVVTSSATPSVTVSLLQKSSVKVTTDEAEITEVTEVEAIEVPEKTEEVVEETVPHAVPAE